MRRRSPLVAIAILALAAAPLGGCFVLDELEAGEKIMDAHSPKKEPETAAKPAGGAQGGEGEDARPTGRAWWSQARSLDTRPPEGDADAADPDTVVRCDLGGAPRFMRRGDCLSQGGRLAAR